MDITTTKIWDLYEKGRDHHRQVNMYDETEREHAFYIGDQWRGAKTGGEELPVLNFIKPVVKYKVATIAQNQMAIVYSPMDNDTVVLEACDALTSFAAAQWEKLKMDTVNWEVIKKACITGDHYVYFFDATSRSGGLYSDNKIKLKLRSINKTNVYFSDEQNPDINDQDWIIISERVPVSKIKAKAEELGLSKEEIDSISPDSDTDDQIGEDKDREVKLDEGKCTSLLYMSLKDGKLRFCRSVKSVIYEPEQEIDIDVYPLCGMRWESKPGDSRGVSGVKQMIPNQLEVNKTAARRAIAVKRYAYPALAYDSQKVQNIDALSTVGANIAIENMAGSPINSILQYLNPAPISGQAAELQNELIDVTQKLEGAGDAALGQVDPTKASGEAIKAARDQAAVPLNEQYASYKQFIEDIATLWLKMWVTYSPEGLNAEYGDADEYDSVFIPYEILEKLNPAIKIDASPIDPYSRLSQEATLGNLLTAGHITFEEYVDALSDDSGVPKAKLQKILDDRQQMLEEQMGGGGIGLPEMPVGDGYNQVEAGAGGYYGNGDPGMGL